MNRLILALMFTALTAAAAPAATLSVHTADGLVVAHGEAADLEDLRADLARALPPGATNAQLLRHIFDTRGGDFHAAAYMSETEAGGQGQEIAGAPAVLETTVREAERAGFIPSISGKELFEASLLIEMRGDTFMILDNPPQESFLAPRDLFVFSSAYGSEISGIYVDGRRMVPEKDFWSSLNGYKFLVLDPDTGKPLEAAEFPTFDDPGSGARMAQFLNALPEGALIAGAVQWGPGVFLTGSAINAMRAFGAATEPDPELHMSHAFIGRKGMPPGQALEASSVQDSSRIILFSHKTYLPPAQAQNANPAPGSRIIALRGTAPEDPILIIGRDY